MTKRQIETSAVDTQLMTVATDNSGCDLDEIMRTLDEAHDELPEEALRMAQANREAIIPRLIHAIESATAETARGHAVTGNAHFFALFLLTEFQVREAWPAIRALLKLPGEGAFELYGDLITESLSSVLAVFLDNDPDQLDTLISDQSINEYIRWEGLSTYKHLVRDQRLTRDEAVARLHQHLKTALTNRETPFASFVVTTLVDYAAPGTEADLRAAFRQRLVDTTIINERKLDEEFAAGEAGVQRRLALCSKTGVADTVEFLRPWYTRDESRGWTDPEEDAFHWDIEEDPDERHPTTTIRNSGPQVGRNDPCPCGSGRKFKKCCGKS